MSTQRCSATRGLAYRKIERFVLAITIRTAAKQIFWLHCQRLWLPSHGRRKGGLGKSCLSLNFEIWHFPIKVSARKLYFCFDVKTNSHFLPCRSCSNFIKVAWRVQLRCDAVFMTLSPSSSLRFSMLAVIFRTTLNKITFRRFQLHLRKASVCSGISFHVFIFTYSPAFTIP